MTRKLMILVLAFGLAGCTHNLQESYVDAMDATYEAVQSDVKAGLYKPDANSKATLKGWKKANEDARKALEADAE